MKRRRFVAVSAAATCPCIAAGCLADSGRPDSSDSEDDGDDVPSGGVGDPSFGHGDAEDEDDEETQDDDDDEERDGEDKEPERAHEDGPILGSELEVHDERRNGHPLWIDSEGRVTVPDGPGLGVSYDWEYVETNVVETAVVE